MQAPRVIIGCALGLGLVACANHDGYVLVTVDARPAVHDARSLSVTLANGGTMRTDSLDLKGQPFPVTFSVSAPGRTGDLAITVDAVDENSVVVGQGSAMTKVSAAAAKVTLDPADFVVNTDYAGDQFPTDDPLSTGLQLAALPDGTWTAVFRDSCMQNACNVFARRFGADGKPVTAQAAAGTNAFVVTARPSDTFTEPAVASSPAATVAMWDFTDPAPVNTTGVACRTLSAAGGLGGDQTTVSTDFVLDAPVVAALPGGDFVASWSGLPAGASVINVSHAIVKSDCTPPAKVQAIPTTATFPISNAVAASDDHLLFTWVDGGALHANTTSTAGALTPADTVLIPQTATDQVAHTRLAAVPGGGFSIAVRWLPRSGATTSGKIELYQVNPAGSLVGMPALVTDQSGSDDEDVGFASRPDGTVLIAWHTCNLSGDACTVSGRIMKATGEPVTDAFAIPTTTGGSQRRPSVVGLPGAFAVVWSDTSGKAPDTAGQAVRARIVYPPGS
jgi:hypothetical protein